MFNEVQGKYLTLCILTYIIDYLCDSKFAFEICEDEGPWNAKGIKEHICKISALHMSYEKETKTAT